MHNFQDFFDQLEDITKAVIRVTSSVSIVIICARIIWDKLTRKK